MFTNWYLIIQDSYFFQLFFILLFAVFLDLIFGDPEYPYHPVRLMGRTIVFTEAFFRKIPLNLRISGFLFNISNIIIWLFIGYFILEKTKNFVILYLLISSFIIYSTISLKCLMDEAKGIKDALKEGDLPLARTRLSRIVGRDTQHLNHHQISMATIESVSENFVDGVISPFFYGFLLGPLGALVYRVINTMDSMVGYKNEKYRDFGFFSARLDDLANYIPARLSIIFIGVAGLLMGRGNIFSELNEVITQSKYHSSPNSGIPESCFAHCLNIKLGGVSYYGGIEVKREFINEEGKLPEYVDIESAIKLLFFSAIVYYSFLLFLCIMLYIIF